MARNETEFDVLGEAQERLIANLRLLIEANRYGMGQTAGLAGMHPRALQFILSGSAQPGFKNLVRLAAALGVELHEMFLPTDELADRIEEAGLRPFVLSRPARTSSDSASASKLSGVAAGADRSRYRQRKPAAQTRKSASRKDSGTMYFAHRPADLQRSVRDAA